MTKNKTPAPPEPLLPVRTLVILFIASVLGVLVGVATWLAFGEPWAAVLAGGGAAAGAVDRLHSWTGK